MVQSKKSLFIQNHAYVQYSKGALYRSTFKNTYEDLWNQKKKKVWKVVIMKIKKALFSFL